MPAARQLTTAELDKLLEAVIKRGMKASPGDRAGIRKEFEALLKQKDQALRDADGRLVNKIKELKSAESENVELKKRLENNFNTNEGNRSGESGRRRTGTAGDAAREKAARDAAAKNPAGLKPRGNLNPGDIKKPPSGLGKTAADGLQTLKDWDKGLKTKAAPFVSSVNNSKLGNFVKDSSSKLSKAGAAAGSAASKIPGVKLVGKAGKFLGPISYAAQLGQLTHDLIYGGDMERALNEKEKFNQGIEEALVSILTKQNRMKGMIQALASSNAALMASQQQLMIGLAAMAESIDAIEDYSLTTKNKVSAVNFAAIKNSADEAARIAQENKTKLGHANFTLHNQAAQLAKTKLEIIDATQLMGTSRLAEKKLNILDATQLMSTSRLAEKKWDILDATQLMSTSRLAEKKWNILDATQLMGTSRLAEKKWNILDATQLMSSSRMAETKWGILDVTQLMRYSRSAETQLPAIKSQLTQIESKISPAANLNPILAAINAIPSKFPSPINISGLTSQLNSISTQIVNVNGSIKSIKAPAAPDLTPILTAINNIRFPFIPTPDLTPILNSIASIPSKIPTPLAPNLTPLLNAINNIKIPTPAAPDLSLVTNQLSGLSAQILGVNGAIASIPSKIPTPTPTDLRPVLNAIDAVPSKIKVPAPDLTPVLKALDPIASNAADISAALSAPLFKAGMPIKAHDELLKIGQQTDSGINPTIVKSLPAMFMALSAVAYTRSGHHRLGGTFDKSVMNPAQGKVKITDMVGLQKWSFDQIDQRMGLPTAHTVIDASGKTQTKSFQSIQDAIEESNALNIVAGQDIEVVERYLFALTQDLQKLMQISLQTREDVDVIIDDLGCKFKEIKRSHPTHINLTSPGASSSLSKLFEKGRVHYVGREWADSADKNQKLERIGYDTQIAAMSNKFDLPKTNPSLPLDKSRANAKTQNDQVWRTFVSTMEEPPEGYISKGNPTPDIKEIKNGTPTNVPKPTVVTKKLGK
jgi:hypothetical protein